MENQLSRKKVPFDSPLPGKLGTSPLVCGLAGLFKAAVWVRNSAFDTIPLLSYKAQRPVISIGGIRAGGTGKTPVAQFVGQYLTQRGYEIAFLSRGYGRVSRKPVLVKPGEQACWEETGDEPAQLHSNLPHSWLGIGADRVGNARRLAPLLSPKAVFVLDDGFQHRKIRRDLDIVCLHEQIFHDRLIPAGYLREPVESLSRAKLFVLVGSEEKLEELRAVKASLESRFSSSQCSILLQKPSGWVEAKSGRICDEAPMKSPRVVCAIARPQRFVEMVRSAGMEPAEVKCFEDHHVFQRDDLTGKQDIYSEGIMTTEKDFMRLRSLKIAGWPDLWYLKLKLRFADDESETKFESVIRTSLP
ncbi:MAG: tetraacyldisaccharide 4'-kinase [Fibrobacterota bacterium]